jgi:membrane associated rhomboid family serine protease
MGLEYRNDEQGMQAEPAEYGLPVLPGIPVYTYVLVACIIAVTVAQFTVGLPESVDIAGFDKPKFLHAHEYWRILTGAALHGGFLHIFMNGYALYGFGSLMELLSNRAHLGLVFLLSAVGGGLLSLVFMPDGVSVGASGGIVGFIGYLLVYAFRRRQFISSAFRRSLMVNIGFLLIFGLLLYNVVDNFGHIGGLLTGFVYGLIQIPSDEFTDPRRARPITKLFGIVAIGVFVLTSVFSIFLLLRSR